MIDNHSCLDRVIRDTKLGVKNMYMYMYIYMLMMVSMLRMTLLFADLPTFGLLTNVVYDRTI